jgi:uncharacterized membrane protein HdeD (DUF308 family)
MAGKKKDPEENEAIEKEKEKDPNNGSNYLALVANIMISILLMTVGLSMLFITGMKPLYYTYIVIGFLLVWGITCTVRYFAKEEFRIISNYDFAFGIIILILSACMILRANEVSSYFHLLLGCLALVEGVVLLQHTIQMKQLKGAAWFLNLLMSLALIAFSVITILNLKKILDPNSQAFYILLVAAGLLGILSQILVAIRARRFRKSETEEKTRKERKEEEKEKEQKQERLEDFEQNYGDSFSGGNTTGRMIPRNHLTAGIQLLVHGMPERISLMEQVQELHLMNLFPEMMFQTVLFQKIQVDPTPASRQALKLLRTHQILPRLLNPKQKRPL